MMILTNKTQLKRHEMEKIYGAIVILSLSLSHGKITIFLPFSGEKQRLFFLPLLGSSSEQTFFYTKGAACTNTRTHSRQRASYKAHDFSREYTDSIFNRGESKRNVDQ